MTIYSALTEAGIPMPPESAGVEQRLQFGLGMVARLEALGADVVGGPFLDIGCGWGRIPFALLARGFTGRYVGVDVNARRIDWLSRRVTPRRPNFTFHFTDYKNDRYNRQGKIQAPQLSEFAPEPVATAVMLSVFTHMWEEDIRHYLRQVRSVIAPDAAFVFTAFILTPAARQGIVDGKSRFPMPFRRHENCRYLSEDDPLHAIACGDDFLDRMIRDAGFAPTYQHGRWSGAMGGETSQDWIVARPI